MASEMNAGTVAAYLKLYDTDFNEGLRKANAHLQASERAFQQRFGAISKAADSMGNKLAMMAAGGAVALGGMVKLAMEAVESENLFTVSLGKNADSVRAWSEGLRKELGLNGYELRKNTGMIYSMLNSMGAGEEASLGMSKGISQLAYDMASFYNLKPEEAFQKLRSGISGEIEPLRQLGISVDENTAKAYLLKNGIKAKWSEMDQASKVAIRYKLILEQTANAQGDLARTIDSPTNKLRVMAETAKQTATDIGMALLPAFERVLQIGGKLAEWLGNLTSEQKKTFSAMLLWSVIGTAVGAGALKAVVGISDVTTKLVALNQLMKGGLLANLGRLGITLAAIAVLKTTTSPGGFDADNQDQLRLAKKRLPVIEEILRKSKAGDWTDNMIRLSAKENADTIIPSWLNPTKALEAEAEKFRRVIKEVKPPAKTLSPAEQMEKAGAEFRAQMEREKSAFENMLQNPTLIGGGEGGEGTVAASAEAATQPSLLARTHQAIQKARDIAEMLGWSEPALADEFLKIYQGALLELRDLVENPQAHPAFPELMGGFDKWSQIVADFKAAAELPALSDRALEEQLGLLRAKNAQIIDDVKLGNITREQAIDQLRMQQDSLTYLLQGNELATERQKIELSISNLQGESDKDHEDALKRSAAAAKDLADQQERSRAAASKHVELMVRLANLQAKGNLEAEAGLADQAVRDATFALGTAYAFERANPGMEGANRVAQALNDLEEARQAYKAAADRVMEADRTARAAAGAGYMPGVGFFNVEQPPEGELPEPREGPNTTPWTPRDFAPLMWNFARDRNSIREYFDQVRDEVARKGLFSLLAGKKGNGLQENPVTGLPEFIHSVFPQLDKLTPEKAAELKTRVQGGMGVAASVYSLSQAGGAVPGAMAGLGLMQGLNQLGFTAAGGPVGAAIGLIGGAIIGANQAREQAEEMAQRLREQQLEQLRRISNALLPVSDYFRRGLFGALPSSMSFGGMNPEYSWSVQHRAGMQ